jgi:tetratricopeptide (TPR) repeat protein
MDFITNEEAEKYCSDKLQQEISEEEIKKIISIINLYKLEDLDIIAYKKLGKYYFDNHNYEIAFKCFDDLLILIQTTENKDMLGCIYNFAGACKYMQMKYIEALTYFDKANFYAYMYHDGVYDIKSLLNSAMCYRRLKWYDKAIEYADLCILKANSIAQKGMLISANIIKINCHEEKKEYDLAIKLSEELIKNVHDKENLIIGNIYNNLGGLYLLTGNLEKSLINFDKSIEFRANRDPERLSHTVIEKAQLYITKKMYKEALELLNLGCDMALKYNYYDNALRGYKEIIRIYETMKSFADIENVYIKVINIVEERNPQELKKVYLEMSKFYIMQGKLDKANELMKLAQRDIQ